MVVVLAFSVNICQAAEVSLEERLKRLEVASSAQQSAPTNIEAPSREQDSDEKHEEKLEELQSAITSLRSELAELKAQKLKAKETNTGKVMTDEQIEAIVSKAIKDKQFEVVELPAWVKKFTLSGDFRYRYEWVDDESKTDDRNRNRIRARISLQGKVNDEVKVAARLASGDSDGATSTNQTLDGSFSSKNIWLDLAYFDYHPSTIEGLGVVGGKIKNPFFLPGKSDLMWDGDVNPEGVAITLKRKLSDDLSFFGAAAGLYVEERSTEADSSLWGVQGSLKYKLPDNDKAYLTAGGGFYDFGNAKGHTAFGAGAKGNTTSGGNYSNDFDVTQIFAQLDTPIAGMPVSFFYDYLYNTVSSNSEDAGYLVGATIGKCKKPGSWKLFYNYRELEADATIGAFSDADFGGGGTAVKGHKFGFGYQLAENLQLGASYYMNDTIDTNENYNKLHVDLKYKF